MPRDPRAYLADILDSCDAITTATINLSLHEYQRNRMIRSSVEREFIIIGEAMAALARIAPETFDVITRARRSIGSINAEELGFKS
jgi:uncharacterized protein with HEPN domain